jgi:hypothetical protein
MRDMTVNLTFHNDAGHGWLEMPLRLFNGLYIADKISGYSYIDTFNVYLEEDCDASIAISALRDLGFTVTFTEKYTERSPIRNKMRIWGE